MNEQEEKAEKIYNLLIKLSQRQLLLLADAVAEKHKVVGCSTRDSKESIIQFLYICSVREEAGLSVAIA